jgi:hypothetical protein
MAEISENSEDETDKKIEYLFKIIGRYDTYISSTNAKASLVIAWNGIVIGTILLKYRDIVDSYQTTVTAQGLVSMILILIGLSSALSILLVVNVIYPFLKPTSRTSTGRVLVDESAVFFGSVAKLSAPEYERQISELTSDKLVADLTDQAVILAQGLNNKMRYFRWSTVAVIAGIILIVLLLVLKLVL